MKTKLILAVLLLAMAVAAVVHGHSWTVCDVSGAVGEHIGDEDEMLLYSEGKFLSYEALRRDSIPCGRRGNSYYNCRKRQRANPYRRGCSAITGCARFTD